MALDQESLGQIKGMLEGVLNPFETKLKTELGVEMDKRIDEKLRGMNDTLQGVLNSPQSEKQGPGGQGIDAGLVNRLIEAFISRFLLGPQPQAASGVVEGMTQSAKVLSLSRTAFTDPMREYQRDGMRMMAEAIGVVLKTGQTVDLSKLVDVMDDPAPAPAPTLGANGAGGDWRAEAKRLARIIPKADNSGKPRAS